MSSKTMSVAFLGGSTGVGLSALRHTLAAGHRCIALCRTPSKLTDIFPPGTAPNLRIVQGNAHDAAAVSQCLQTEDGHLVDGVVSTIGARPVLSKTLMDDPEVCGKGMAILLEALAELRRNGAAGNPHIVACSTASTSRFGRDYPLSMMPLYAMIKAARADKTVMEDRLVASGEAFTIVRPSHLTDGETTKPIRVGVENPKTGRETNVMGYTISREDAGRWVADNVVLRSGGIYVNKIALITY